MNAPFNLADQDFDALISSDDATTMLRDTLPGHIRGIQQTVLLAAMNKAKIVEYIESEIVSGGEDAAVQFLETVDNVAKWADDLMELADTIRDRVVCAMAKVVDLPSDDGAVPCPEDDGFDQLVAQYRAAWSAHDRAVDAVGDVEEAFFARKPDRPRVTMSRVIDVNGRDCPLELVLWEEDLGWLAQDHPDVAAQLREAVDGYNTAYEAAERATGMKAAEEARDAASDLLDDAFKPIAAFEVATLDQLETKLDVILQYHDGIGVAAAGMILADVRRLDRKRLAEARP